MGLKEDDIRSLGDGLEFGSEPVPQAVGADCGRCQDVCETKAQKAGCSGSEWCAGCQSGCMVACEYSCQSTCQKSKQCSSCESGCQSACEKSSQCGSCQNNYECGRCEYGQCYGCEYGQCGSCESYQGCQTTCERSAQCSSTCEKACQSGAQTNSAPSTPSTIFIPSEIKGGDTIKIQWGASTDSNLAGYILEKKADSGAWTQIYKGASRDFTDTVAVGTGKVQYRVRAYDTYNAYSGYKTSAEVSVTNNSAPVISGKDEDLGGQKSPVSVDISVSDKEGDTIDLVAKLNGTVIKSIKNAKANSNITITVDAETFNALPLNARNEIEVSATDGKATSYRRFYFSRINSAPEIELPVASLGKQNSPFSFKYVIKDQEGDTTDVRFLYADMVLGEVKGVELGREQTFTIKNVDFAQIPAGEISIKIEAKDDKGGVSNRLVSFIKEINGCGYVYKKETPAKATQIIVTVSATVDEKSTLKVSVCNNANDSSPAWEEITDQLDKIYNIKNTSKTASKWALGVKTEIIRGKDAGDSYLDAVGINFR